MPNPPVKLTDNSSEVPPIQSVCNELSIASTTGSATVLTRAGAEVRSSQPPSNEIVT